MSLHILIYVYGCVSIYTYYICGVCIPLYIYTIYLCVYMFTYLKIFVILLLNRTYKLIKKLAFFNSSFKLLQVNICKCNLFYA